MTKKECLENLNNLWEEFFSIGFKNADKVIFEGAISIDNLIFHKTIYYPETSNTCSFVEFE